MPDIDDIRAVTAVNLDSLLAMYNTISQRAGMQTKDLFDFVVLPAVKTFLEAADPSTQEIIAVLPELNLTLDALSETRHVLSQVQEYDEEKGVLIDKTSYTASQLEEKINNKIVSMLAGKIGSINFLDLSQPLFFVVVSLSRESAFIPLLTSPATLSTILDVCIFYPLLRECSDLWQPDQRYEDKELANFSAKHKGLFDAETHRMLLRNLVEKVQKEHANFAENCRNFLNIITSTDNLTDEATNVFMNSSENKEFASICSQEIEKLEKEGLEKILEQLAQQFAVKQGPNQKIWQQLLLLLNTQKEREEAFQTQQSANRKLYAEALVRVVTEMKRRFDAAVPKPAAERISFDRIEKEDFAAAAKHVWAPDHVDHEERVEQQKKIRAMSPQAAEMLEKMAK